MKPSMTFTASRTRHHQDSSKHYEERDPECFGGDGEKPKSHVEAWEFQWSPQQLGWGSSRRELLSTSNPTPSRIETF